MQGDSRRVVSNQAHLHPKLAAVVKRHLGSAYRRPIAGHNQHAFAQLAQSLLDHPRPIILDSFCGTGHSTAQLAARYPNHLIVGIDQSAHRLAKHPFSQRENYLLLQAQCEDIWRLLIDAGHPVERHFLLYPNPWPKSKHLQRRIHGHPAFPLLLELGGVVELRSNWQVYVEEFGLALSLTGVFGQVCRVSAQPPLTLFEEKYACSGQELWQYCGVLPAVTKVDI